MRISPLPLRIASAAICGRASGRDSKITNRTPSGEVTRVSTSSAAISVRLTTRPRGSAWAAIERIPAASWASLAGLSRRRASRGAAVLEASAVATSAAFARRMESWLARRASAMRWRMATRAAVGRPCDTD